MTLRALIVFLLLAAVGRGQLPPFHAPAQATGSMEVTLRPMENVMPGTSRLVTFGVPFPRGSITAAQLSTLRVLRNGVEIPAFVEQLTPWRHLTNSAIDGQSVRVARVQIHHSFAAAYPAGETITVEWGGAARTQNVAALADPQGGWHLVTSGTFVAADGVMEPDVYALLPKAVLSQGVLGLRRTEPFKDSIPETRDAPEAMDAIEHWPGYEEADRSFKNNFYTNINEDDPLVSGYESGQLVDCKHESEPWLYDRASTFFQLHVKTGFLRPLREAVRATQFYRSQLYGNAKADPYRGIFRLKAPDDSSLGAGGNTTMYSYAECFAYDHWFTGNPLDLEPVRWVAATHDALTEPSRWTPQLGEWTERHTAFRTLADLVAFELTGETGFRQKVLGQIADYLRHQNGADGLIPADRLDGGLYHYGAQHGDGVFTELIASPWMMALTMDAMIRAYGVSEDAAVADFIRRGAKFQAVTTHFDGDSIYEYSGALRYPFYLARYDGAADPLDGYDGSAIEHAKEVTTTIGWGCYFQHLLHGVPDPAMEATARELYLSFDIGVNHWIRPAAPPLGLTAYRSIPPRKFAWENRPSASLSWVMQVIDTISPPPVVAITSPTASQTFTAPADIFIEATASSPNSTIAKVEFYDGAEKIGEDTTPPYTLHWNHVIAALPGHVLTAKAITALGVTGNSEAVPLDMRSPTHPELTITSPANGAVFTAPAAVTVTATATPQAGSSISRVRFTRNYQLVEELTAPPYAHTFTGLLDGDHDYEVWAWDNNGGYTVQTITVRVETPTPPSITLTSPLPDTPTVGGGVLHLAANAAAPGSTITQVVFYADGEPIGEVASPPFVFDWTVSSRWAAGAHEITAEATETNGGTASDSAAIQVSFLPDMSVAFASPADWAVFPFPAEITMEATASAPLSSVARMDFYANNQFIGSDTEAPFTASFTPANLGQWELLARVTDGYGRTREVRRNVNVTGPAIPTVTLAAPGDGSILTQPAAPVISATASVDHATIARVRFYEGDVLLGEDTAAPFSITAPSLSLGDHRIYAVATSSTGTEGYSPAVTIHVGAMNAPAAVITAPRYEGPQIAASFSAVRFAANALHTGGVAIQRVEFLLDHVSVGSVATAPYEMVWTVGPNTGYHELIARAYDVNGQWADSGTVAFELVIPPQITIAFPTSASQVTPGSAVSLAASVIAGTYPIARVDFFVNDALVGTDSSVPYQCDWSPDAAGDCQIAARVTDTRYVDVWADAVPVVSRFTARQNWRIANFGSYHATGSAADLADPDHDGIVNLLEWMFGAEPLAPATAPPLAVTTEGADLVIHLTRAHEAATEPGHTLALEWATEFATWNSVSLGPTSSGPDPRGIQVNITPASSGSSNDAIEIRIPRSQVSAGKFFARVRGGGE
ncbi:Ig-like domain-containing protein [Luteolibacter sp. LG18]|uniref:Ig-like domain-containing protein n=1 Tax=Luteolibacter sp. LG18 TaxID=2819286 RepID=UPI002B28802A|nr:hypothetical protein llg_06070 [Luteolibacter sp. LG18]